MLVRLGQEVQALPRRLTARAGSTGACLLLGLCIAVFIALAVDVTHHGPFARLDPHVAHWSFRHVTGTWHDVCRAVTHLGNTWVLTGVVVVVVAWLLRAHRRLDGALLAASAGATGVLTTLLKDAFRRHRPIYVDPVHGPHSFSFPSGHASGAFVVYVLLAILLTAVASRKARSWAVGIAVTLASVVAASRVLLPVHFASDVIAGTALGLAVVALALLVRMVYSGPA